MFGGALDLVVACWVFSAAAVWFGFCCSLHASWLLWWRVAVLGGVAGFGLCGFDGGCVVLF